MLTVGTHSGVQADNSAVKMEKADKLSKDANAYRKKDIAGVAQQVPQLKKRYEEILPKIKGRLDVVKS